MNRIDINASNCLSESECDALRGKYLGNDSYETLISESCDVYCEGVPILKFRKQVFQEDLLTIAWNNCHKLAKSSRGRGAAAGPIDKDSVYWKKRDIYWSDKWSAKYLVKDKKTGEMKESKMKVNNEVASNPIGFYGKTKGLGVDLPCRLSHYTKSNLDKYHNAIPYFREIAKNYSELMPEQFNTQMERATINDFHIHGTPFSTITINRNFRTAVHKDTGDFGGWACLSVLEENKYSGGYFVLPKFKIAVDMRHGDLLVCDVHQYHANTELYESEEDKEYNDNHPSVFKDNLDVGVLGLNNRFSRLSFVSYLREDIANCPGFNKFVVSLKNSERRHKWENTEYKIFDAVNGKEELSYECESCQKMISYHNIRNTPQHLAKTACLLSHLKLLKHIWENKLNKVIIVEDDALQINPLPEDLPTTFTYLAGIIMNKKITSKEPIVIEHKEGINELDSEKYRMITTVAYYIPSYQIAEEIFKSIINSKRWRAIDIMFGDLIKNPSYIYPAIFQEDGSESQIMNKKKKKFANEFYKQS